MVNMNYSYVIIDDQLVIESINDKKSITWIVRLLCKKSSDVVNIGYHPESYVDSYYRTKEWFMNKYPEHLI